MTDDRAATIAERALRGPCGSARGRWIFDLDAGVLVIDAAHEAIDIARFLGTGHMVTMLFNGLRIEVYDFDSPDDVYRRYRNACAQHDR